MNPLNEGAYRVFRLIEKAVGPAKPERVKLDADELSLLHDCCHLLVNILKQFSELNQDVIDGLVNDLNDLVLQYDLCHQA